MLQPGLMMDRPLLVSGIIEHSALGTPVARWWVPDEVIFLDALPVGGTGKVQKTVLREKYGNVFD
jgi:3-(methylthio)propionyl---CoA ligase